MRDLYSLYIEEYIENAEDEMNKYLGKDNNSKNKEGVYKENYYFRDNLQIPYVSKTLEKRRNRDMIVTFVSSFLDNHSTQLSTSGPVHMFTFGDKETDFLYQLFGVDADTLLDMYNKMVNEAFYGKISSFISGWVRNAPHKILITSMLIEGLQKNYQDIIECCEYLWAFCEYPILYRNFWKTGVKEDVMNYTIEHLGSKFKVKKVSNLQGLLKYDAHSSVESKREALLSGTDVSYTDFMYRMRNQIKNTFKNISRAYYDNIELNATQHKNVAVFDDGSLADQEGHITNIAQAVDKTISKFAVGDVNTSIARIAADGSNVDKDNLIGYINQIKSTKNNRLDKLIESIITSYFVKNPTDTSLGSGEFLNFGLKMYRSIGTSKDPMYQQVKEILTMWMNEIIEIRKVYSSEGTIINYTRAIFNYMILMINHYN